MFSDENVHRCDAQPRSALGRARLAGVLAGRTRLAGARGARARETPRLAGRAPSAT